MIKLAPIFEPQSLYELSKKQSFDNATQHWQDQALASFIEGGVPSRDVEAWRYVDLSGLLTQPWVIHDAQTRSVDLSAPVLENSYRLVFVNGVFDVAHSTLTDDIVVLSLQELLKTADEALLREWSIDCENPYFAALNSALMREGCCIEIKAHQRLDKPIHILHVTTSTAQLSLQTLRFFIRAKERSQATILEEHVGEKSAVYFNNIVTQMNMENGAQVNYYKFQHDNQSAYHLATTLAALGANSEWNYHLIADGALLNREDVYVRHYDSGSQARLVGFYSAKADCQTIQHTRVDHLSGRCSTTQYYKGMARDQSKAVFDGKMVVHPGAAQSSVHQTCHNLLLSNRAEMDVKPNLEIYNDDVSASHGATVGELDEQALFYLQSRGIPLQAARELLMIGFVESIFEHMPQHAVTDYIRQKFLGDRLI